MSARPDTPDPSVARLRGDGAYPDSQVSYGGATYWLERCADGAKRLLAVANEASAFERFTGAVESREDRVLLRAETTPHNALALRSALPWLNPVPLGLHTSV